MSTLSEIEEAISILPASQVEELAVWLQRWRDEGKTAAQSGTRRSVREFFGCFASGDVNGGENRRIDADLAREAAGEM